MNKIAVVKSGENILEALKHSIELSCVSLPRKDDIVVIKPNICNSKNPNGMVITDFGIIEAVVNLLKENGNPITIVESDNISGSADKRMKETGLLDLVNQWDINYQNLSKDDYEEHEVAGTILKMPKSVLDADYFVNLPKIKTCAHTLVTLSIKNLYGVFMRRKKNKLHKKLDEILPYLAKTVNQDLIIVDGLTCMEGNGPVIGNPLKLGILVTGSNPVSIDSICSRIMGYNPINITHISNCYKLGLGEIELDKIEVVGDDWTNYSCEFEKPYTLTATIKSVKAIKDIYLTKNG